MQKMHDACTVPGCARPHKARGYCQTHYMQFKRGVPITPIINARQMVKPESCSYEGCPAPVKSKGLCAAHYQHKLRHGHTRYQDRKRPPKPCSIPGCQNHAYSGGVCSQHYVRRRRLAEKYGLTPGDVDRMLAEQGGVCAICQGSATSVNGASGKTVDFCVDHCHVTKKVRGMLCSGCNRGIGLLQDNPELLLRAAAYLQRFPK